MLLQANIPTLEDAKGSKEEDKNFDELWLPSPEEIRRPFKASSQRHSNASLSLSRETSSKKSGKLKSLESLGHEEDDLPMDARQDSCDVDFSSKNEDQYLAPSNPSPVVSHSLSLDFMLPKL